MSSRRNKLDPRSGLTVTEDEVNPVRARERKVESLFPWIFIVIAIGVVALIYFLVTYLSNGARITVENPTSHTYYAAPYCISTSHKTSDDSADTSALTFSRYRKAVSINRLESADIRIPGGYKDGSQECFLLYGQHRSLPRKVTRAELVLWSEQSYRDNSDTNAKWLTLLVPSDKDKIEIVV